jgi:hypothetical protein
MHEGPPPLCPYCQQPAIFRPDSVRIYGHDYGPLWECTACAAWVGVHRETGRPLGRLADSSLRSWKRRTHLVFDGLWRDAQGAYPEIRSVRHIERIARTRAYLWLADQLRVPADACHIGAFDIDGCRVVIATIQAANPTAVTIRAWAKARAEQETSP